MKRPTLIADFFNILSGKLHESFLSFREIKKFNLDISRFSLKHKEHQSRISVVEQVLKQDNAILLARMLDRGLPLNYESEANNNDLIFSVIAFGSVRCLDLLLERNISINQPSPDGMRPIWVAAQNNFEIFKKLIKSGVDIEFSVAETPYLIKQQRPFLSFIVENEDNKAYERFELILKYNTITIKSFSPDPGYIYGYSATNLGLFKYLLLGEKNNFIQALIEKTTDPTTLKLFLQQTQEVAEKIKDLEIIHPINQLIEKKLVVLERDYIQKNSKFKSSSFDNSNVALQPSILGQNNTKPLNISQIEDTVLPTQDNKVKRSKLNKI